jgi:hypothetical protein
VWASAHLSARAMQAEDSPAVFKLRKFSVAGGRCIGITKACYEGAKSLRENLPVNFCPDHEIWGTL